MSPLSGSRGSLLPSFPRVSGDEPTTLVQEGLNAAFSPRERG